MIQKNEKGSSQIQPTTKQFESLCFLGCSWLEAMARTQIHFNGHWFINHPNDLNSWNDVQLQMIQIGGQQRCQ